MISFEINQQTGKTISRQHWREWFKKLDHSLGTKKNLHVSVAIIGDRRMKQLNWQYRKKNKTTDVLSFGNRDSQRTVDESREDIGEIIISYPQAARQAKQRTHSVLAEIEILLVHGFLHLLGYDHERRDEAKVMQRLEKKVLQQLN